ncbi:type II secretion system F family protein [Microbacterium esteraromaticum]|uniref:type II secretion system F family protein n=1 Tax=Microbacterium esteraromaticum TaxID=57043 RepID=UPI0021754F15|nr:type II secretion system F family protein [Microbacterium esteraromaticum]
MSLRRRSIDPPDPQRAAAAVRTLAVLLQAGARPLTAWRHLADTGDPAAVRIVARMDGGSEPTGAIEAEGGAWSDVAAAWEIATTVGAPLAEVLRTLAESLQDAASAADDVRIALAEPTGTARLLLWLPLAGLLLGFALGFDIVGVLTGNPIGIVCVVLGVGLVLLARWWTARMVRAAQPDAATPGMHAELVAVALAGGVGIPRALRLVEHSPAALPDARSSTDAVLELSRSAGVPAGELLRASAAQQRHESRVQGRVRAARLSSTLLLPLGVCTLPAFLLLGVAPLMLSVLATTPLPI